VTPNEQNINVGCSLSEVEVPVSGEDQRLSNNQGNSTEKSDDTVKVRYLLKNGNIRKSY
jgi:hypothetical protein